MLEKITKKTIHIFLDTNSLKYKSTHQKLSIPIINRIYKKMINGIKFENIKTCENLIIDGRHRYISASIAKTEIGTSKYPRTSATVVHEWKSVDFTEIEWDTEDKIQYLNKIDAEFNNITLEKIIEITK